MRYNVESDYIQVYDGSWHDVMRAGLKLKYLFINATYSEFLEGFSNVNPTMSASFVTIDPNGITISTTNGQSWYGFAVLCSLDKVNYAGFSKLSVKVRNTNIGANSAGGKLYITLDKTILNSNIVPANIIAERSVLNTSNNVVETFTLDISGISEGYIMISNNGSFQAASSITISEIWLHN